MIDNGVDSILSCPYFPGGFACGFVGATRLRAIQLPSRGESHRPNHTRRAASLKKHCLIPRWAHVLYVMMGDDMSLVRKFAASRSEPAFTALVKRHIGLVHAAAMRQVGDSHLAEEIAHAVFILLARKAPSLGSKTVLSAWLYRTARYAAANASRARSRRQHREQEAYMQSTSNESEGDKRAQVAPSSEEHT